MEYTSEAQMLDRLRDALLPGDPLGEKINRLFRTAGRYDEKDELERYEWRLLREYCLAEAKRRATN